MTWCVRDRYSCCGRVSTEDNPSDLLTKAIASPSKFAKFQAVLLGEAVSDAKVMAIVAKRFGDYEFADGVARCFLVRRERL